MSRHQRILIVDARSTNFALLKDTLGKDYILANAVSGEDALAIVTSFQPDLVLLDSLLPGMNGDETCRRLREMPAFRHVKILMLSANASAAARLYAYEAGADDYITTPFHVEELLARIRAYLRLKSAEELDQLKSYLLGILRHKTLTPIRGILEPLNVLLDDGNLHVEEGRELLQRARDSTIVLAELVDKIADLCAMKTGNWPLHLLPTDLSEVVASAIQRVAALLEEHSMTIDVVLPTTMRMSLDPQSMVKALVMLLENAIQSGREGNCITIELLSLSEHYQVNITYQGRGLAPDVMLQLYEDVGWSSGSASPDYQGLNLALARQIIFAHNGLLTIESQQDVGTTYKVLLPFS